MLDAQTLERIFENEVRRIARALWPEAHFQGAVMVENRERDGVFVTEDVVHIVEATTSRQKAKAQYDCEKIVTLSKALQAQYQDKVIRGWFITQDEPTIDQAEAAKREVAKVKLRLTSCSFETFRKRLIDAASYLEHRSVTPFGSIANLSDGSSFVPDDEYVELDIVDRGSQKLWSINDLITGTVEGQRFVLLGDYGAGKSMSLRQIFVGLKALYLSGKHHRFPVYLNLRDHHGQKDPAEAFLRHAVRVGFANPEQLIRAWRAGACDLILDGFDELATSAWVGMTKKLRQIRHESMSLVRDLVKETPNGCGMTMAGRLHYFDSEQEMSGALNLGGSFSRLDLNEFNDKQVRAYLRKKKLPTAIPAWIPTRPLLLGYIISRGVLQDDGGTSTAMAPDAGWDMLIRRVCERESAIAKSIDATTVREILERVATFCRQRDDGLGPLYQPDLESIFSQVVGYPPDAAGLVLLMRLPGLGPGTFEDGGRRLIDADLADAARAGDVLRFIEYPFGEINDFLKKSADPIGELGCSLAASKLRSQLCTDRKISIAIEVARSARDLDVLRADVAFVIAAGGWRYDGDAVVVSNVYISSATFSETGFAIAPVSFENCVITNLAIDGDVPDASLPKFHSCAIETIDGRVSRIDLPKGVFDKDCEIRNFAVARTNSEIFELEASIGVKVLLTVLKKLYLQKGRGRRSSALYRGLDHSVRRLVPDVLQLLEREGLAIQVKSHDQIIWLPSRSDTQRVRRILAAPTALSDRLLRSAADIV